MTLKPVLQIEELRVGLGPGADRPFAVDGISLQVQPGEVVCVVGESGSGKSMMAKSILRLLSQRLSERSSGRILFEDQDLLAAPEETMRRVRGNRIAMVFQEPMVALNPLHRVGRQVEEILEVHTELSRRERAARAVALFEDVRLPNPALIAQRYPHQLSGGQRQRVMIAMALAMEPALIIADEPTTALDVTTQAQILKLLRDLQRQHGTALLFITHDFGVVAEIADRVVVMHHGRIVEQGAAAQILTTPREDYTRKLLAAVPSLAPKCAGAVEAADKAQVRPILAVQGLIKTYGGGVGLFGKPKPGVQAVRSVDFSIPRGGTVALVGESGSGKSTVARCIMGLELPDAGRIMLDETDLAGLNPRAWGPIRREVQMIFQDPFASLNPRMRVVDIVGLGPRLAGVSAEEARATAEELMELVGLRRDAVDRYPHAFSGGQRQRIGIARALAMKPKLIVADEPVSALDVSVQRQVLDLLAELRRSLSLSILFITHDLRVAADVCEDIVVMCRGEVVERGATEQVFRAPAHPYTRSLLDSVPGRSSVLGMA